MSEESKAGKVLIPVCKTGRCSSGFERDRGRLIHAAWIDLKSFPHWGPALCGTEPGRTSGGWDTEPWCGGAEPMVTCEKCLAKINKA